MTCKLGPQQKCHRTSGFTLIEVLVSLTLSSAVVASLLAFLVQNNSLHSDRRIILETEEKARLLGDMMAFDLRALGAGVPLYQPNFSIDQIGLGNAPLPILTTSTATNLEFRINEYGRRTVITADYNSTSSLMIDVLSTSGFSANKMIYISNASCLGKEGMQATLASANGNLLQIDAGFFASPGAIFKAGSTVDIVNNITYTSPDDDSGIWREVDGAVGSSLLPGSSFNVSYLDRASVVMAIPLTTAQIANDLSSIILTVTVDAPSPLRDGSTYTATVVENIVLRNLIYSRP